MAGNQVVEMSISNMAPRPNEKVDVTIWQTNTGNESLSGIWCWLGLKTLAGVSIPGYAPGKGEGLYLGPGETRKWQINDIKVEEPMAFIAKAHGIDSLGIDITDPDYPEARSRIDVYTYGEPIEGDSNWPIIIAVGGGLLALGAVVLLAKKR